MATNNSINSSIPIEVSKGGTGVSSFTNNGVFYGNGTSAIGFATGTTGKLLVSTSWGAPSFGQTFDASGAYSFRSNTVSNTISVNIVNTVSGDEGNSAMLFVEASNNISPAAASFKRSGNQYIAGIPYVATASPNFMIWRGTEYVRAVDILSATPNGEINYPSQPAFSAYGTSDEMNVTGDGTYYQLAGFNTEIFDQNNDFATSIFTAPVSGRYLFSTSVLLAGLNPLFTQGLLIISTSNGDITLNLVNAGNGADSLGAFEFNGTCIVNMDALDTAAVKVSVGGSTKTITISHNGSYTRFSGYLLC